MFWRWFNHSIWISDSLRLWWLSQTDSLSQCLMSQWVMIMIMIIIMITWSVLKRLFFASALALGAAGAAPAKQLVKLCRGLSHLRPDIARIFLGVYCCTDVGVFNTPLYRCYVASVSCACFGWPDLGSRWVGLLPRSPICSPGMGEASNTFIRDLERKASCDKYTFYQYCLRLHIITIIDKGSQAPLGVRLRSVVNMVVRPKGLIVALASCPSVCHAGYIDTSTTYRYHWSNRCWFDHCTLQALHVSDASATWEYGTLWETQASASMKCTDNVKTLTARDSFNSSLVSSKGASAVLGFEARVCDTLWRFSVLCQARCWSQSRMLQSSLICVWLFWHEFRLSLVFWSQHSTSMISIWDTCTVRGQSTSQR